MHVPPRAAPYSRQLEIGRSQLYMGCLLAWLATGRHKITRADQRNRRAALVVWRPLHRAPPPPLERRQQ
jgi:hypothetical protein